MHQNCCLPEQGSSVSTLTTLLLSVMKTIDGKRFTLNSLQTAADLTPYTAGLRIHLTSFLHKVFKLWL